MAVDREACHMAVAAAEVPNPAVVVEEAAPNPVEVEEADSMPVEEVAAAVPSPEVADTLDTGSAPVDTDSAGIAVAEAAVAADTAEEAADTAVAPEVDIAEEAGVDTGEAGVPVSAIVNPYRNYCKISRLSSRERRIWGMELSAA
jgi:hypothetical protein